ncbi:MAG: hypothetical protein GQ578_06400, partial [Desulfuromonadaceae bacterium]|nr:hypothetical protein [Desulfuromonadaceae bacterium]
GIIGPLTTHYINSYARKAELLSTIKGLRFCHYLRIVRYDQPQEKYFRGWVRRIGIA